MTSAATSVVRPIAERIVGCIWVSNARRANYLNKFEANYNDLMDKRDQLVAIRDQVKERAELEESTTLHTKRTHGLVQWLGRVEVFEREVDVVLEQSSSEIKLRCCGDYCPKNWRARYRLGKIVCSKLLKTVKELIDQGKFDVVVVKTLPPIAQVQSENVNVGMDATFKEVWGWLQDEALNIIGVYGMGGVGKTTLLKKINNMFLLNVGDLVEQAKAFDLVIWVDVSKHYSPGSVHSLESVRLESVQKQIGKRLGLSWSETDDLEDKARSILQALSNKKFVVLLDDVREHMKLGDIGIPFQNNSKILFTTRSEKVCRDMKCNKKHKIPFLVKEYGLELFKQNVGEVLDSSSEILALAEEVADECGGLPLALIVIGQAMAAKDTVQQWKHAIKRLKYYASPFLEMEQKVLAILKFSNDALEDENVRNCFLYFSLYPEDCPINKVEIVQRWIGEGFLDISRGIDDDVYNGHHIINTLKDACLLEGDRGKRFVKMHSIVRDLALWIGCGENNFWVQAGFDLIQMPEVKSWKDAARISLMDNGHAYSQGFRSVSNQHWQFPEQY